MIEGQIREHMEVVGSDDKHVGKVDNILGDQIELTREMAVGKHHLLPISLVAFVDDKVHLAVTENEAKARWVEKPH